MTIKKGPAGMVYSESAPKRCGFFLFCRLLLASALAVIGALCVSPALAAVEAERLLAPDVPTAEELQAEPDAVKIRGFSLDGNLALPSDELMAALDSFVGKSITLNEIEAIETAIFNVYSTHGFLARASIPAQDLSSGQILIVVTESTLGEIRVSAPDDLRYSKERAEQIMRTHIENVSPLSVDKMEYAAKILDKLPGIASDLSILPSGSVVGSDLQLTLSNTQLFNGTLQVDNLGLEATGDLRKTANIQINSFLHYGEKMLFSWLNTEGSDTYTVDLELPVGVYGTYLVLGGRTMDYRVINNQIIGVDGIEGDSYSYWIRTRNPEFDVFGFDMQTEFGYEFAHGRDYLEANGSGVAKTGDKKTQTLHASGSTSWVNPAQTASVNTTLKITGGELDLGAFSSNDLASTEGNFVRLTADVAIQGKLTDKNFLAIILSGQLANKNLDRGQELMFSGASAVRGYEAGLLSVDEGFYTQAELSHNFSGKLTLSAFVDYAAGKTHHDPYDGAFSNGEKNRYSIAGAGLGLRSNPFGWLSMTAQYAHRVGRCDGCSTTPGDDELWLIATASF